MTKKIILILAIMTATLTLAACAVSPATTTAGESATADIAISQAATTAAESAASAAESAASTVEYIKITASEAKALMDEGNVIVLDVRSQDEYDDGHIAGAIRLEYGEFPEKLASVLPDKDAIILVYCRSGNRSKTASSLLIEAGYTQIMDFGGIIDWPYEVVR